LCSRPGASSRPCDAPASRRPSLLPGARTQGFENTPYVSERALSGVYYLRTHEGANTVNFRDPRPQTGIIRPPVTELTAENTDQVVVKVSDGTLLMFPSWLPHSVDASGSDEMRISLSFNVMPSAYSERMSNPLW
jgi:uncharacterized protein (TIGR02466 family)